ncbi:MAG: RnfABCDGE type electron transport complex subunit D [Vicinamibacterales bacterium]
MSDDTPSRSAWWHRPVTWLRDPRHYQIAVLSTLLTYGILRLEFDVRPGRVALLVATALLVQAACVRLWRVPRFDARSPLISALSLSLLLRTNDPSIAMAGAALAIAGKFLVRVRGKHLFNPTNFALAVLLAFTGDAWVSPGQWGSVAFTAALMACLGGLVVNRAARSDVTWAFIAAYTTLVTGRAVWLGDPFAIPLHHLQSGALLVFTFFMISDPRTTPDSRAGRVIFATLVALVAWWIQFGLFRTNGPIWALAGLSLATPLLDRIFPGTAYTWSRPTSGRGRIPGVPVHETTVDLGVHRGGAGVVHAVAPRVLRVLRREG